VPLTSYRFGLRPLLLALDPAVTSNALEIQIVFPLIRVTSLAGLGLPAPLGKQKGGLLIKQTAFHFSGI